MSYVPTLKKVYTEQVFPALMKSRGYTNKHQVPKILKVSLNTGIDAEADKNQIADIQRDLGSIAGQNPSSRNPVRLSRTSNSAKTKSLAAA